MKSKQITTILLLFLALHVSAQRVDFDYDINGNRISRVIVFSNKMAGNISGDSLTVAESLNYSQIKAGDNILYDSFDKAQITIYPNPTSGKITIAMSDVSEQKIHAKIVSPIGSLLSEGIITNRQMHEMDLNKYANGRYFLVLTRGEKSITWIIIKN
ncbi:MAG: T9SS type A sorting domain-containing protein [Bacteroidales bacterium]|nr:T9SS type A sorting domain-containing protein [Bacteroidales bacterium]MDZ4205282.1 T9SS type A sorting domain-containing protein [Bacteroidales bacterium]